MRPSATSSSTATDQRLCDAMHGTTSGAPVTVTVDVRAPARDGSMPLELSIVNLLDDPTVRGYVVTGHDVTERVAVETELRAALSLLRATLDSTADGILVVDEYGSITSCNRRFAEMWHMPDDRPRGPRRRAGAVLRARSARRPRGLPPEGRGAVRAAAGRELRHARLQRRSGLRALLDPPARRRACGGSGLELPRPHGAQAARGRARLPRVPRPAHRAPQQGPLLRPGAARGRALRAQRRGLRRAVPRHRQLQDRQRLPRPRGGRPAPRLGRQAARQLPAGRRHAGPPRRRRVRGAPRARLGPRHRVPPRRADPRRVPRADRHRRTGHGGDREHRHRVRWSTLDERADPARRRPGDVHREVAGQEPLRALRVRATRRRGRPGRDRRRSPARRRPR